MQDRIILGLGPTGLSCARYLQQCGLPFSVIDSRENPPCLNDFLQEFPSVPHSLGHLNEQWIRQARSIIISSGLNPKLLSTSPNTKLQGDIELFNQAAKAPIIAITGTNGKSTVTTLIGHLLNTAGKNVAIGGNLGQPALDLLNLPTPDFYVLELSSFQLETTQSLSAEIAVLLNITEDHLDRHSTIETYQTIKRRIYHRCQTAVWNRDDPGTIPPLAQGINFGSDRPQTTQDFGLTLKGKECWLMQGSKPILNTRTLTLQGHHNRLNSLAALAVGHLLHVPLESMLQALTTFQGLPHRCERIAEYHGITWINDSKGTNVGATLAALTGLGPICQGQLILIAGGLGKDADFKPLRPAILQYVRTVILLGQDAHLLQAALENTVPLIRVPHLKAAVQLASSIATPGDWVLLSPACSSYDMFQNYQERGIHFSQQVHKLQSSRS